MLGNPRSRSRKWYLNRGNEHRFRQAIRELRGTDPHDDFPFGRRQSLREELEAMVQIPNPFEDHGRLRKRVMEE